MKTVSAFCPTEEWQWIFSSFKRSPVARGPFRRYAVLSKPGLSAHCYEMKPHDLYKNTPSRVKALAQQAAKERREKQRKEYKKQHGK